MILRFNSEGINLFTDILESYKIDSNYPITTRISDVLFHQDYTEVVSEDITIDNDRVFTSKYEFLHYLDTQLGLDQNDCLNDLGLWGWITAYYFELLCPSDTHGQKKVGQIARYIPQLNWNSYYRHLIVFPMKLLKDISEPTCRLFLMVTPNKQADILEVLASRREIITCKPIVEAAYILYWDNVRVRLKPRVNNRDIGGNPRRFVSLIQQLKLNYDFDSLTSNEILELLPDEFNVWKQ